MGVRVTVIAPPPTYALDPQGMAEAIAEGMRDFFAAQLEAGKQPDGSRLPLNDDGKPLGRGDGTFVRTWKATGIRATKRVGRAITAPNQEGKLAIVVRVLRRRGVKFQGTTGAAAEALARLISDEVDRQHRQAVRGGAAR
jgi:hypothetical protein